MINDGEVTDEVVKLIDFTYIDGDIGMHLSDFQDKKFQIKKFSLSKDDSQEENIEQPPPPTTQNKVQYCYYRNSCNETLELTFYKYTSGKERVFNNGKKLMGWEKDICPTSVVLDNYTYVGKSSSCTGSGSVKSCLSV